MSPLLLFCCCHHQGPYCLLHHCRCSSRREAGFSPLPLATQRAHHSVQRVCYSVVLRTRFSFPHCGFFAPSKVEKRRRESVSVRAATYQSDDTTGERSIQLYGQIERVFTDSARRTQGTNGDSGRWEEIEDSWVIRPSKGVPIGIVHFVGGVFVGAAPQLTYRLFLERLSERGFLVVATPFASGFDHLWIANEVQFKFDRCMMALRDEDVADVPKFGVGHSLGALIQLLIGSRYAVHRAGNVLISFNNKEASEAIPLFSPLIAPMAQNFGPVLTQLLSSPTVRYGAEMAIKSLQNFSPPLVKQILPLVEQLQPLYMELVNGKDYFTPHPDESSLLIKSHYGVGRNLLLKFKDDQIDETPMLAQLLSADSVVSSFLDMSVCTLPGDHARPLQQILPEVPSAMASAVTKGGQLFANLVSGSPWADVARDVGQSFGSDITAQQLREQILVDIEKLVDEISYWMIAAPK